MTLVCWCCCCRFLSIHCGDETVGLQLQLNIRIDFKCEFCPITQMRFHVNCFACAIHFHWFITLIQMYHNICTGWKWFASICKECTKNLNIFVCVFIWTFDGCDQSQLSFRPLCDNGIVQQLALVFFKTSKTQTFSQPLQQSIKQSLGYASKQPSK